jgi:hypothetical protein
MLATAKSWDVWDWAMVCGGQREGTVVRNMMCISHPSCPARMSFARDAVGAEWFFYTKNLSTRRYNACRTRERASVPSGRPRWTRCFFR